MTVAAGRPVLYVVACGGRPAGDLPDFVSRLMTDGWDVCVIATPSAVKFMDTAQLAAMTGHAVRYDYKQPDEPDVLPPPDAIAVAPATFNTINKWAAGIADTLALGLLTEAIGKGLPVVALPFVNRAQAKHPAFERNVAQLRAWGVRVLYGPDVLEVHEPGTGTARAHLFPWGRIVEELTST